MGVGLHPVGVLHPGGGGLYRPPPTSDPTGYGQRERGTYPTGMHSCLFLSSKRFGNGTNGTDDIAFSPLESQVWVQDYPNSGVVGTVSEAKGSFALGDSDTHF